MEAPSIEQDVKDREVDRSYPGADATVGQLIMLADQYFTAACTLLPQFSRHDVYSSAPMRFCAIHAIELYLNAFLQFGGWRSTETRALLHKLEERAVLAVDMGLCLKSKTAVHLSQLNDQREYLLVRYGADRMGGQPDIKRILATLNEVRRKVQAAIYDQKYDLSDPRFKKYW